MEIKVVCECGQKYAFDVEPQNGSMPGTVSCPVCGKDGTGFANQQVRQKLSAAVPATVASTSAAPGGLRINRHAPTPDPAPAAPALADAGTPPPAPAGFVRSRAYQPQAAERVAEPNILMGLLGGVIGGGIAMAGWYFLTMATYSHSGYAAWFVGVITGVGVRWLGREGHPKLGFIAAVCAAVAILAADFMVVNTIFGKVEGLVTQGAEEEYNSKMTLAKSAVEAKTDAEVAKWLEKNGEVEDKATPEDIRKFRDTTQPELQSLLDGKTTKAEFIKKNNAEIEKVFTFSFRWHVFKDSVSFFSLIFCVFGVITAWRIATG